MTDSNEPADAADLHWMREALAEAQGAANHADVPIGAVIVDAAGLVLGRGHNRREIDGDPTAHAEIIALRSAARARGHWRLDTCTAFVTLEPCAMCAGAFVNARIGRLVYAAADPKAGAIESLYTLARDPRLNHRFETLRGLCEAESVALLQGFFRALRARGEK